MKSTQPIQEENNPNQIIRVFEDHSVFIFKETDDENKKQFYFKASDVGKILDIVNIRTSIQNFDEDEKRVRSVYTSTGKKVALFLTSQGIYRLLYASKKPIAKKFRKWAGDILDDIIFNESKELKKKLEENEKQIKEQEEKIKENEKQLKHKDEENKKLLKNIEDQKEANNWLQQATKNNVSFEKIITKNTGVYLGASKFEESNYIFKIGKSINFKEREKTLSSSSSPDNEFKMYHTYHVISGMEYVTEKYIHKILDPFRIKSELSSSSEHFMLDKKFADFIINKIVYNQEELFNEVNKYIDIIHNNNYNVLISSMSIFNNEIENKKYNFIIDEKQCSGCELVLSSKYFHNISNLEDSELLCKKCIDKKPKEYNSNLKDKILENCVKTCSYCTKIFNKKFFFLNNDSDDGYNEMCIPCYNKNNNGEFKYCATCDQIKNIDLFRNQLSASDAKRHRCRECELSIEKNKEAKITIKIDCDICGKNVVKNTLKQHKSSQLCIPIEVQKIKDTLVAKISNKKTCENCNKELSIKLFFKLSNEKNDICSICIPCYNKNNNGQFKCCTTCFIIKSMDDFTQDISKSDNKHSSCRVCKNIQRTKNGKRTNCDNCGKDIIASRIKDHKKTKSCLNFKK